jgi:membrane protein YdbS with pleckstrin-like domain
MTAYQPTTDTVTLSSNAVLYLALRRVFHFVFLSCVVSLFIYVSMHGPIRGNAAIVVALGALGAFFVGVFLLILAIQLAYNYFLVSSYRIQMRPDGVALHYGVFNTSNEVLLFSKIQDIVINCNILERMMGLATLTVQNAMSKPEVIPGLDAEAAEELREQILDRVNRAN